MNCVNHCSSVQLRLTLINVALKMNAGLTIGRILIATCLKIKRSLSRISDICSGIAFVCTLNKRDEDKSRNNYYERLMTGAYEHETITCLAKAVI